MKQAVVLIHGVGEQIPMDTLRGFVKAVWTGDASVQNPHAPDKSMSWSKPDHTSGDFELRRLTTPDNREGRRTDFFEFYWAHLMEGTRVSHLLAWARLLLLRSPARVPGQLRGLWYFLVVLGVALVAGMVAFHLIADGFPGWVKPALGLFGTMLWLGVGAFVLEKVAGDAARYLHVAPPNIESRRRIREAGIKLLKTLHAHGYDRIVVVGHSLGTVIGYDVLTHYWARCNAKSGGTQQGVVALEALEELARNPRTVEADIGGWQRAQSAYFAEMKSAGHPWRVTDFVTLGCPLAHAMLLLGRTPEEFEAKKAEREFPTCPPVLEPITVDGRKVDKLTYRSGKLWVPHHAAVFAPTRWTNVYFKCEATIWGDVIGGPVRTAFGPGILDIPAETTKWGGLFSHTLYWIFPAPNEPAPWIVQLRRAVRICESPPPADQLFRSFK